ncbi:MAG: hypothetical protein V3T07_05210 [Myxococcota bacterium]
MSRTLYLPVTNDLTGDTLDVLPAGLLMRSQANELELGLPRTVARQYFPFGYDYPTDAYSQADQVITDLGVIDPVELWERCGPQGARNAPDDYIATLSIRSVDGTGDAIAQVIDAAGGPRGAPIPLVGAGETQYGIPLFTGDRITVIWDNRPVTNDTATVILNLTEGAEMELQEAAAAWQLANAGGGGGVPLHASTHEAGGSDVISVAGLTGLLATAQTPTAHASTHELGGSDEILLESLATAAMTATDVFAPDGAGGVIARPESAGGGSFYFLIWAAKMDQTGRYARCGGNADAGDHASLDPRTEWVVPVSGTADLLVWNTEDGAAGSTLKMRRNGVVVETIAVAADSGSATLTTSVTALTDRLAIEYDAGTDPQRSTFELRITI